MFQPWVEVWAPIKGDVIIGEEDRIVSELGVAGGPWACHRGWQMEPCQTRCQLATCQNLLVWIPSILLVPCISWWNCERSDVGNQRCPDPSFTQDWYPFIFGQKIPIISVPSSAVHSASSIPSIVIKHGGPPGNRRPHPFVDVGNSNRPKIGGFSRPLMNYQRVMVL